MVEIRKIVVVIGNGFDIAHGFPTKYIQFSDWLLKDYCQQAYDIILNNKDKGFLHGAFYNKFRDKNYLVEEIYGRYDGTSFMKVFDAFIDKKPENIYNFYNTNADELKNFISSEFILSLFATRYNNWFDIERVFFDKLYSICKNNNRNYSVAAVRTINRDLEYLKLKLKEYLGTLEIKTNEKIHAYLMNKFSNYQDVTIIDFNYTKTISTYNLKTHINNFQNHKIINIHGSIEDNNIIFGYGNDLDEKYQELKGYEINEIFDHFKTVDYSMFTNYSNMKEDINSNSTYNALVIGHSLGMTDKTLLQEILENDNCNQIELLKRNDLVDKPIEFQKDFRDKIVALTRIINKEKTIRSKVINFLDSDIFP